MSRSFLNHQEQQEFLTNFKKVSAADFSNPAALAQAALQNSLWLEETLISKLKSLGPWEDVHPILIGSWARNELCPASDLDIIFVGPDEKVFEFVSSAQEQGLKLRYRVPKSRDDWQEGVQPFDILALFGARALTPFGEKSLQQQKENLQKSAKLLRKQILKAVLEERLKRQKRLDSITNFLEPNIKYAPGALRDVEQALQIYNLFSDKVQNAEHAIEIFKYYKNFWLLLRQRLHIESQQDIMSGADQLELSQYFGFESLGEMMKEVEKGLSRAFFYSEWLLFAAKSSEKLIQKTENLKIKTASQLAPLLKKDSGILMQKKVRESLDQFFPQLSGKSSFKSLSKLQIDGIKLLFDKKSYDQFIVAVFSSRLIDKLLPPVEKLVGHVQHDQYHRFTADIHLQQACRQFLRVRKSAREMGPLAFIHRQAKPKDWEIVGLACLFHDLSKGTGGDHSHKGAEDVFKLLPDSLIGKETKKELAWLVENHLLLTSLAFKRSSFSWRTIEELQEHGATKDRLRRLVIFTVIDIKATNPEAWTHWKAQLIRDFMSDLESPEGQSRQKFQEEIRRAIPKVSLHDISYMDSFLLQRFPSKTLVKDLKELIGKKSGSSVKLFKVGGRLWVRFYEPLDRKGLLVEFLDRLQQAGASVQHASVQTLGKYGVYDWFQIQISKGREKLLLQAPNGQMTPTKAVQFDPFEVSPINPTHWLVTLRAKDQKGLLKWASQALSQIGANIRSAQVHTWGLKVEDIFVIEFHGTEAELKEKLSRALAIPQ
jgi:[protein-PII] uridylyltransferase